MPVPSVLPQDRRRLPEREVRFVRPGQGRVGGGERLGRMVSAASATRRRSTAASPSSVPATASPSSPRYARSTARVRAASTAPGEATDQTAYTYSPTIAGLKLWNVSATRPAPASPSGTARQAK